MNKEKLGMVLTALRNERPIESLTAYTVQSIEDARASYPVPNLIAYCNDLSIKIVMTDMATDESYPVDNISDVHSILQMLMGRYQTDHKLIYRKTGIHYTAPASSGGKAESLRITTLLAMCDVLHCKLDFIQD